MAVNYKAISPFFHMAVSDYLVNEKRYITFEAHDY